MPGIHSHKLDFEILETGNTKTLVFLDSSVYMEAPEKPLLEVIMPGFNKYSLVNVIPNRINSFNSSALNLDFVFNQSDLMELPDGIWEFKYKICPYNYVYKVKRHMRVAQLSQRLEELHCKLDLEDDKVKNDIDLQKELAYIYILFEGAKASANKNPEKAASYYRLADKLVKTRLDKLCKHCV